jgi:hypothetical protein
MPKFCPTCEIPLQFENLATCPNCGENLRPALSPVVIRHPIVAAILSFFFIGWGQWYNGKTWSGLKFFVAFLGCSLLLASYSIMEASEPVTARFILIIGGVLAIGIWIYGIYDAYKTADGINRGKETFLKKSRLFWIPVILFILGIAAVISVFVFGMGAYFQPAKIVTASAIRQGDNIIIAYQGGTGHSLVSRLKYGIGTTDHTWNSPKVGERVTLYGDMPGKDHLIVSVVFNDGSERVLLDSYV